jgi:hypothetical protein
VHRANKAPAASKVNSVQPGALEHLESKALWVLRVRLDPRVLRELPDHRE